jgi:hypothetical protein
MTGAGDGPWDLRGQRAAERSSIALEECVNTNTLLLIIVLVLIFGGGGFFWGRR